MKTKGAVTKRQLKRDLMSPKYRKRVERDRKAYHRPSEKKRED